jgi:hypothetical protein
MILRDGSGTPAKWTRTTSLDIVSFLGTPPRGGVFRQGRAEAQREPFVLTSPHAFQIDRPTEPQIAGLLGADLYPIAHFTVPTRTEKLFNI